MAEVLMRSVENARRACAVDLGKKWHGQNARLARIGGLIGIIGIIAITLPSRTHESPWARAHGAMGLGPRAHGTGPTGA